MKNTGNNFQMYRTRFLVKAKRLTRRTKFVDALGHEHQGVKGDYLIEGCDGTRRIAQQKFFEDVYVIMELPPDGRQSSTEAISSLLKPGRKKNVESHRPKHESRRLIA